MRCPQRPTAIEKGRNLLKSIQLFIDVFFLEKVKVVRNVIANWDLLAIQHSQFSQRKGLGNVLAVVLVTGKTALKNLFFEEWS